MAPPRPRRRESRGLHPALIILLVLVALGVGGIVGALVMSRMAGDPDRMVAATDEPTASSMGRLEVTSTPEAGTVVVDGRLVGLTPIERIDLDPGRHAVVIDVFGYQPYAGTITIVERGAASLEAVLAELGGEGTSNGRFTGQGAVTNTAVPRSALAAPAPTPASPPAKARKKRKSRRPSSYEPAYSAPEPRRYEPPPRPRRDCGGERSTCKNGCSRAETSCRFDCPHCVSCPSSVGWDNCKSQCAACRKICEQNVKFCESSCKSSYDNCNSSQ